VQIFNSPTITFKSEIYIVLMNVAWTYLLHAHYRKQKLDYRYFQQHGARKTYDKTRAGAHKHWELERCLNEETCPIDKNMANNLRFLIGIRHEIEHQMTTRIDSSLSAKFQACCLNYNDSIKRLFGEKDGIDKHLSFSLQFSSISREQADSLPSNESMPAHIKSFVQGFEDNLSEEEFNSPKFAYRLLFVAKTANRKGQADQVIEFVKSDSALAADVNKAYTVIKETERPKHRPANIIATMSKDGYSRFNMHHHTKLWQNLGAKADGKGLGVNVEGTWFWYDSWIEQVKKHCQENPAKYGKE